jgi:hypothetical protein
MLQATGANAGLPTGAFAQFGRPPNSTQLATPDSFCGRTENSPALHAAYCDAAGQNLMSGWGTRRSEWQFGLGVQHELLPRLSGEVTFNHRKYQNLTDDDELNLGCDFYLVSDADACFAGIMDYRHPNYDFFRFMAPTDPRLPNGGGYRVKGVANQNVRGNLPGSGEVTTIQKSLEYTWNGIDTNFVYRGRGGLRISGGTSTGGSERNTCLVDGDNPNVKGREGNEYGGGCIIDNPWQTNVRATASYTVPWVDVLLGVAYQSRPGGARSANWAVPFAAAIWEPGDADRATGGGFFGGSTTTFNQTQTVNLLDTGDLYGERISIWDLKLAKNVRFAGKRVNFGLDIYNVLNSDAVTGYNNTFTATRLADGTWQADNPATPAVEVNNWGNVTNIINPRFARVTVTASF